MRRGNSLDDGGDLFLGRSGMTCFECTADRELFVEDVFISTEVCICPTLLHISIGLRMTMSVALMF